MSGHRDILIVDDDPTIRAVMRAVLEREGFVIHEAEDGEAALARCREQVPDLVFLDLSMPGMDGLEVLRKLKADERTSSARVVIVTARGEQERAAGLEAGAAEFFAKPFSPLSLLRTVEDLLKDDEPGS